MRILHTARILASAAALGLAGYALYTLVTSDAAHLDGMPMEASGTDDRAAAQRERDELTALVRSGVLRPGGDPFSVEEEAPPLVALEYGNGIADARESRIGFEFVMGRVERLGRRRRRLSRQEWNDTYRAANEAFSALSMHLDASNPAERAELDKAYHRLQEALEEVHVRGGKHRP